MPQSTPLPLSLRFLATVPLPLFWSSLPALFYNGGATPAEDHPSTAWDSEIESLTSLIKLHQNEWRSAPCGQIGAAAQPPELAISPTSKNFWVARAFEVGWTCTCCHDRPFFFCYSFLPLIFSLQFFLCFICIGGVEKHHFRGTSPACWRHMFNTVFFQLPAAKMTLSIRRLIGSQNGLSPCTTLNAHSTLAYSQQQHQATSWWHHDALVRCRHAQHYNNNSSHSEHFDLWRTNHNRGKMKEKENENTHACGPFLVHCSQLSMVSFLHLILTIAWVITTSRWARKLDHSKKKQAMVKQDSAMQSSHAGWRYREGDSSYLGPTPQSLSVCAAFFSDQARSNWHPVTSATPFHCPKLYNMKAVTLKRDIFVYY